MTLISERLQTLYRRIGVEPYWYLILPLLLLTVVLYIIHLVTGATPNRVAISIPSLDLDVYWYGIWIVGGIALGGYVVSRLVLARALRRLDEHVPPALQHLPLTQLDLPEELEVILVKRGTHTVGDLLLRGGFDWRNLGLNQAGVDVVLARLQQRPGVDERWLTNAPWRVWNPDHVWNGIIWCLVLGIIGARLYHVFTPSPSMAEVGIHSPLDYFRNPFELINLRRGGLGIYGGIVGGFVGLVWYTRRQRLPTLAWADLAAIGLALGQVFGRWGNFFNQELYGRPTNLPWAVTIDPQYRLPGYAAVSRFHPAFLYESLWNLLTFVVLLALLRRYPQRLRDGDLMALYLIAYATGRILLETVRLDSRMVSLGKLNVTLPVATLVSLGVILFMAAWIALRHRRSGKVSQ